MKSEAPPAPAVDEAEFLGDLISPISGGRVPRHVAVIMDGNGRWATQRGLPRAAGHRAGTENIRRVIERFADHGVQYLTLYAFSTENWSRPQREVRTLIRLLRYFIKRELNNLHRNGIRLRLLGHLETLPDWLQKQVSEAIELTSANERMTLNICFSYGGRDDILTAIQAMVRDEIPASEVTDFDGLRRFPHFQDEWLRDLQPEMWVPAPFKGKPYNIFETGGTTGMPKQRIGWNDYKVDYSEFSEKISDAHFPRGGAWLMMGPTGPRRLRLSIEHLANVRGSSCYFIDLDPRWVKKVISNKHFDQAKAYMEHVVDQAVTILKHRKVSALFTTVTYSRRYSSGR